MQVSLIKPQTTQRISIGSNHNSDHRAGYLAQLSVSVSDLDADNAKKMFS